MSSPQFRFLFFCFLIVSCGKSPTSLEIEWELLQAPIQSNLNGLLIISEKEWYITGGARFNHGVVIHTTDAGQNWQIDSLDAQEIKDIAYDHDRILVAGDGGQLFTKRSSNNDPWERIHLPTFSNFNALAVRQDEVWLCSGQAFQSGRLFHSQNSQDLVFKDSFEQELSSITYSEDKNLHAVGYGLVLRSSDDGKKWEQFPVWGDFFRDVFFPTPQVGYIVGHTGTILKTINGGVAWEKIRNPSKPKVANAALRAVYFSDEKTGCVVGEKGVLWITVNGGDSWNQIANVPAIDLFDVRLLNNTGYAVGENGTIFRFLLP